MSCGSPGRFCIVGTDRTTASGDVANKIGTYTKALAAPTTTFRSTSHSLAHRRLGNREWCLAPNRAPRQSRGHPCRRLDRRRRRIAVRTHAHQQPCGELCFRCHARARLVTGLITERGICRARAPGSSTCFSRTRTVTAASNTRQFGSKRQTARRTAGNASLIRQCSSSWA